MKKLLTIPLLLLVPLLLLGCSADSLQTANVEAADPVVVERPAETAESEVEALTAEQPAASSRESCAVTPPPQEAFVPPEPYSATPYLGHFYYGTEALWTSIPNNQTWEGLPYDPATGFGQKVFFQRAGYDWQAEPEPALTVNGRRLDAEAPPAIVSGATNGFNEDTQSFMLVGVEFPTAGCWELTAEYGEDTLSFVIWVAP